MQQTVPSAEVAAAELSSSLGLLNRRLRQRPAPGDLSLPERSALARLERGGPMTASELAKQEQISPQSIGATLATLTEQGLIERTPDPGDGRRVILTLTDAGRAAVHAKRAARNQALADALESNFTTRERELLLAAAPLLERLAQSV